MRGRAARAPCVLALLAPLAAPAQDAPKTAPPGVLAWREEPQLQHPRSAHALAATDQALFVVGGTGGQGDGAAEAAVARPIREVERFDCREGGREWRVETELPGEGLNAPAAVIFEDRLWVLGGFGTTTNVPVATVRVYDPASRAWSEAPPLPAPRGGHAAVVFGGRIHVFGGGNSRSTLADHCAFEPASRTWRERAPLARPKGSPAAVVFEGRLWSIGGRSGNSDFGDVECFDEATNAWTPGPPIAPRGTAGAAVFHGALWVVGGEAQAEGRCLASTLRFDPVRRAWEEATALPAARNYARTAVLFDALFVVGGSRTPGASHAALGSTRVDSARLVAGAPPRGK